MFEEVGHHVEKIRRVRYGPLSLDVPPGEFRSLTLEEVSRLKAAAAGENLLTCRRPWSCRMSLHSDSRLRCRLSIAARKRSASQRHRRISNRVRLRATRIQTRPASSPSRDFKPRLDSKPRRDFRSRPGVPAAADGAPSRAGFRALGSAALRESRPSKSFDGRRDAGARGPKDRSFSKGPRDFKHRRDFRSAPAAGTSGESRPRRDFKPPASAPGDTKPRRSFGPRPGC